MPLDVGVRLLHVRDKVAEVGFEAVNFRHRGRVELGIKGRTRIVNSLQTHCKHSDAVENAQSNLPVEDVDVLRDALRVRGLRNRDKIARVVLQPPLDQDLAGGLA